MEYEAEINDLEAKFNKLRRDFDLFFTGESKKAPYELRREVQTKLDKMIAGPPTNTSLKFKLKTLNDSFISIQHYWDRVLYQIEMGTYAPDRFKADIRVGKFDKKTGKIEKTTENMPPRIRAARRITSEADRALRSLFSQYIEARRVTNERTDITLESFKKSVEKQLAELKKKFGEGVRLQVMIENNKTKLKAIADRPAKPMENPNS